MVGTYRLLPKGHKIFSIKNQLNVQLIEETIIQITHTMYNSKEYVFAKPIYQCPMGGVMDIGCDEWSISLHTTDIYIPKLEYTYLDWSYENKNGL
jgi:hypothetical protein